MTRVSCPLTQGRAGELPVARVLQELCGLRLSTLSIFSYSGSYLHFSSIELLLHRIVMFQVNCLILKEEKNDIVLRLKENRPSPS